MRALASSQASLCISSQLAVGAWGVKGTWSRNLSGISSGGLTEEASDEEGKGCGSGRDGEGARDSGENTSFPYSKKTSQLITRAVRRKRMIPHLLRIILLKRKIQFECRRKE